jgi:hypothetical protein
LHQWGRCEDNLDDRGTRGCDHAQMSASGTEAALWGHRLGAGEKRAHARSSDERHRSYCGLVRRTNPSVPRVFGIVRSLKLFVAFEYEDVVSNSPHCLLPVSMFDCTQ